MGEPKIVKVRLELDDGTYMQIDDPEEVRKWDEMAHSQADMAYLHGCKYESINWKRGRINDGT